MSPRDMPATDANISRRGAGIKAEARRGRANPGALRPASTGTASSVAGHSWPECQSTLPSILPMAGAAFQVGNCDDDNSIGAKPIDKLMGKSRHDQPARLPVSGQRTPGVRILRNSLNGVGDFIEKPAAETAAF